MNGWKWDFSLRVILLIELQDLPLILPKEHMTHLNPFIQNLTNKL